MQTLKCSNCGADLPIENQFIRTVSCRFCGSTYLVSGSDSLQKVGEAASLANYPSRLSVGMTGQVQGRGFRVIGRIRYSYDAGFWEEWQITWDDGAPPDWLEEDEGLWVLYRRERIKSEIPAYESIRVGKVFPVNNYQVFVTEKRQGRVTGFEGQFSSVLPLHGTFGYFEGSANDQLVSINFWEDEIELSIGTEFDFKDVVINK
jgi:DNA-directed RNA polymerase subunit RPC12/RpoP